MRYLIGEILSRRAKEAGVSFRVYALDHGILEGNFNLIRTGVRCASAEKVTELIGNLEPIRDTVKNEVKALLETVSTETLIEVYNLIYNREIKNK